MGRALLARIGELLRRRRVEQERDDEFRFHLECEIAHRVSQGASPEDARREALIAFGGTQRFAEETRDARGFAMVEALGRDIRFALRRLRRAPAFALATTATLGVGVGAAVGIGAVVYGVMLRPLPYPDSARLVQVSLLTPGLGITTSDQSEGTFVFLAERARSFDELGAYMANNAVSITEGDTPERVPVALLTPNLLRILHAVPAAGRLLGEEDVVADLTGPVMISCDLWRRRFGADPAAVGKYIELNRTRRLIAGVMPCAFAFPSPETAIYYPMRSESRTASLTYRARTVIGHLAKGVSVAQAQHEIDALLPRLGERYPEVAGAVLERARISGRVETMRDATIAPVRSELRLLAALVGTLLLIAVANVATLALLRAERLHVEVAVIAALGASAGAVRRRFIVESVLVTLAGATVALPIAASIIITKLGAADGQFPRLHEVAMSPALVGLLYAIAVVIGVALGIMMAARAARGATHDQVSLRAGSRSTASRGWRRVQATLVALQISLAMALLLDAGLLTASIHRLAHVDLGFVARDGAQFSLQIPFHGYETYQRTAAFDLGVVDALRRVSGITEAAASMELPSTPQLLALHPSLEAARADGRRASAVVRISVVSPQFFELMRIPIVGRTFEGGDLSASTPGVILSRALARELFGAENPVGREVRFTTGKYPAYRVVGVSGDVFGERVADGALRSVYYPLLNDLAPSSTETEDRIPVMPGGMHFIVRSRLSLDALESAFRAAVRSVDPRVPVWDVRTLDNVVAATTARLRLSMILLGISAIAALLLGAIGIYSVVAYAMVGRAPELAIRLALGASPASVVGLVYRENAMISALGVAGGVVLSIAGSRIVRGLLYGVAPTDFRVFAASIVVVAVVAASAVFTPARRAGSVDPATVLRG